jgi:hypothetical protein
MAQTLFDIAMNASVGDSFGRVKTNDIWNLVNEFMMVDKKKTRENMADTLEIIKNVWSYMNGLDEGDFYDENFDKYISTKLVLGRWKSRAIDDYLYDIGQQIKENNESKRIT